MPKIGGLAATTADFAVVAHVFYHDLWDEIAERLAASDLAFDLFVTITDKGRETDALIEQAAERFPRARYLRYPEPGRDVLPFVHLVNAGVLDGYRAVCRIHTNARPTAQDGDPWRRHLIGGILPEGRTDDAPRPLPRRCRTPRSGSPTASTTARPTGGARTTAAVRTVLSPRRGPAPGRSRLPGRLDVLAEALRWSR